MATNKDLTSEILHQIVENGHDNISVDNDSFFLSIASGGKQKFQKRAARLVGLTMVLVVSAAFVIYSAIFYIQNVLLFSPTTHINRFGTFIRQSYNSEYAMFLFNPSEPWAVSGIQVQKNDRLFISASGAFHTNYAELVAAVESNKWADMRGYFEAHDALDKFDPKKDKIYRYVSMTTPPSHIVANHPLTIDTINRKVANPGHLDEAAYFGDVLFQIVPESQMRNVAQQKESRIYAVPRMRENKKETCQVSENGVVSFCVNDNKPYNNIGQVLVVMEIYRQKTLSKACEKLKSGRVLELPYFWYDFWSHKGYPILAALIFICLALLAYGLLCLFVYFFPFLFIRETWTKLFQHMKPLKKSQSLLLVLSVVGLLACTPQKPQQSQPQPTQQTLNVDNWKDCGFATQEDLDTIAAWYARNDTASMRQAFEKTISFGTAGLRDLMSPGTNRMNMYSVARATQGLANYIKKHPQPDADGVVVGYDCRHNSKEFAQMTADVLSANGIKVYLFESMRPTPEISYAIRNLHCVAGVNITASHNKKEYNGYKAYWKDGGQIVPPVDKEIVEEVKRILDPQDIQHECNQNLIETIGEDIDAPYIALTQTALLDRSLDERIASLRIAYSPMHGAGYQIVPRALNELGVKEVSIVPEQLPDNGLFASVQQNKKQEANPEDPAAMGLLLRHAKAMNADLAVATDPDADRFGFICKDSKGQWHLIDGHQSTMLFTNYIIRTRQRLDSMPDKAFMGRTIVTSDLVKRIAKEAGVKMYDEYTGFKWLAHRIEVERKRSFIGAGEESYCYLPYADVRDKDAPASICLLAEMTADAQRRNTTLWDDLMALYQHFGFERDYTIKQAFDLNGRTLDEAKKSTMDTFRKNIKRINGERVKCLDYQNCWTAFVSHDMFVKEEVLQYYTPSGIKVTIRPSGTEPSLKYYMEIPCELFQTAEDYEQASLATITLRERILIELNAILYPEKPHPYYAVPEMPNALHYLPGPPAYDEMRFAYDKAQYNWGKQMRPTARGEKAKADAEYSIERMAVIFSPAMGVEISKANTPELWRLLTDATKTADFACDSAKATYMRPRPYMVFHEPTMIPEDEEPLSHNGSYPSGHTTLGWTTALILSEINPEAQEAILKEGYEYGQSRVIAGFHWQSDVDMARVVASAAFARLHTSEAYLKQLHRAQKEFEQREK